MLSNNERMAGGVGTLESETSVGGWRTSPLSLELAELYRRAAETRTHAQTVQSEQAKGKESKLFVGRRTSARRVGVVAITADSRQQRSGSRFVGYPPMPEA